jgi:O-antigen ligase
VIKWIGFYLVLLLVSLTWSKTPSTAVAAAYWVGMSADVGMVMLLMASAAPAEELEGLLRGFVISSVLIAAVAWSMPTTADLRLGNEDLLHPNAIGFEFALASLCSLYLARKYGWAKWVGSALAITLLRTLSKACIIAFLAAAAYYLIKDTGITAKAKAMIGVALGVVLAISWGLLEAYAEIYSQGSQAETLTGRTLIWATSFDIAMEKPWFGHGFYSFRWVVPPFRAFEPWQAHNELLQQFFCYGVLGVVAAVGLYFAFFRQLRRTSDSNLVRLSTALLLFALIRGVVDTERFDLSFPLWMMTALSLAMSNRDLPVPTA